MLQQQHDAVADQVHRRLEARADDQRGVGGEFAVGQRAVGGHAAERIVALLAGAQSVEVLEQVIVGAAQPVDGLAVGLPVDPDVQQRGTAAAPPQHARIRIRGRPRISAIIATGSCIAKSAIKSGCGVAAMRSINSIVTSATRVSSESIARG